MIVRTRERPIPDGYSLVSTVVCLRPNPRKGRRADPAIRRLNRLIHALARREGVSLLPFHDTLEDPQRPGRMPERLTADGDHPSVEGYRLLGERAFHLP